MSSKRQLSEQVLYRLASGFPDMSFEIDERDLFKKIEQIINAKYKLSQLTANLPAGETIPDNLNVATYENVAVTSTVINKSKAVLPVMPISLTRNMGIFSIYPTGYPDSPFIPVQRGQMALLKTDSLLGDMLGQVAYEPSGKNILFSQDLPMYEVDTVTMELVVLDISLYGATEPLPIPADSENDLVEELVKEFSPVTPATGIVNPYNTVGNKLENK